MTRRIVLAIVITVWLVLIVGISVAYVTTRAVLLRDLDESIIARARRVATGHDDNGAATVVEDDRFVVTGESGRTLARQAMASESQPAVVVTGRALVRLADGTLVRTLTLQMPNKTGDRQADDAATVVYRASASQIDAVLSRLAYGLGGFGVAAGVAAAAVAAGVARHALKPLHHAAAVVGQIDERHLSRRIDEPALPPELRPVAARLNVMLANLERSFAQRKQFYADASHELRTPLTALLMTLELLLLRPRNTEQMRDALQTCVDEASTLRRLVQHLFEQVRDEHNDEAAPLEPVPMPMIVRRCVGLVQPLAEQRGVTIELTLPDDDIIAADGRHLERIMMNLVANAIEHSPANGTVRVALRVDEGMAKLTVQDDGPGIAPEHQAEIFEPFYRVERRPAADEPHLGLGLYLVQCSARTLGGRCDLHTVPGQGATFTVVLPVVTPAAIDTDGTETGSDTDASVSH